MDILVQVLLLVSIDNMFSQFQVLGVWLFESYFDLFHHVFKYRVVVELQFKELLFFTFLIQRSQLHKRSQPASFLRYCAQVVVFLTGHLLSVLLCFLYFLFHFEIVVLFFICCCTLYHLFLLFLQFLILNSLHLYNFIYYLHL